MSVYGIVAEYNPFHNGHFYQINEIKKNIENKVVVVMSPNVVQRGDFAVFDKWLRCEAAIKCGADLVLELPSVYAMSTAEKFAFGSISILNALNCVDYLSFGSETANLDSLLKAAEMLENEKTDTRIKELLKSGITYAKARSMAVEEQDERISRLLSNPNDILAVEYIKQLKRLNSKITPMPLLRVGSYHDAEAPNGEFASASYLRDNLSIETIKSHTPKAAFEIFSKELENGNFSQGAAALEKALILKILNTEPEKLAELADVSEGLENRIIKAAQKAQNLEELCELIKTKRYTMARIRRILMSVLLSFPSASNIPEPQYIRILGANENGKKLISKGSLPVLTSLSRAEELGDKAKELCQIEVSSTTAFNLTLKNANSTKNEYSTKPIGF